MLEQVSRALEVMVVLVTICGVLLLLAQAGGHAPAPSGSWWSTGTLGAGEAAAADDALERVCAAGAGGGSGGGHWRSERRWWCCRQRSLTSRGSLTGVSG